MKKGVPARGGAGLKGLTAEAKDVPKIRPISSQAKYHGEALGHYHGWVDCALQAKCPTIPWIVPTTP